MFTLKDEDQYLIYHIYARFYAGAIHWLKGVDGKKIHALLGRGLVFNFEISARRRMPQSREDGSLSGGGPKAAGSLWEELLADEAHD